MIFGDKKNNNVTSNSESGILARKIVGQKEVIIRINGLKEYRSINQRVVEDLNI